MTAFDRATTGPVTDFGAWPLRDDVILVFLAQLIESGPTCQCRRTCPPPQYPQVVHRRNRFLSGTQELVHGSRSGQDLHVRVSFPECLRTRVVLLGHGDSESL
jgi:hypothetical protein